jgi:hypothetical protein
MTGRGRRGRTLLAPGGVLPARPSGGGGGVGRVLSPPGSDTVGGPAQAPCVWSAMRACQALPGWGPPWTGPRRGAAGVGPRVQGRPWVGRVSGVVPARARGGGPPGRGGAGQGPALGRAWPATAGGAQPGLRRAVGVAWCPRCPAVVPSGGHRGCGGGVGVACRSAGVLGGGRWWHGARPSPGGGAGWGVGSQEPGGRVHTEVTCQSSAEQALAADCRKRPLRSRFRQRLKRRRSASRVDISSLTWQKVVRQPKSTHNGAHDETITSPHLREVQNRAQHAKAFCGA